jgi:hypothetical protein
MEAEGFCGDVATIVDGDPPHPQGFGNLVGLMLISDVAPAPPLDGLLPKQRRADIPQVP